MLRCQLAQEVNNRRHSRDPPRRQNNFLSSIMRNRSLTGAVFYCLSGNIFAQWVNRLPSTSVSLPSRMSVQGPIGIFDSGYGGLTVMKEIVRRLPEYDYIYLGDNARAPYGNRSFETV